VKYPVSLLYCTLSLSANCSNHARVLETQRGNDMDVSVLPNLIFSHVKWLGFKWRKARPRNCVLSRNGTDLGYLGQHDQHEMPEGSHRGRDGRCIRLEPFGFYVIVRFEILRLGDKASSSSCSPSPTRRHSSRRGILGYCRGDVRRAFVVLAAYEVEVDHIVLSIKLLQQCSPRDVSPSIWIVGVFVGDGGILDPRSGVVAV
jgi:hypothetical protein